MTQTSPSAKDIDVLLAFLPILGADEVQIYEKDSDEQTVEDGVLQITSPNYSDSVLDFFHAARGPAWRDSDYVEKQADKILSDPNKIAEASLQDIKTLLTFCVRAERFCEGSWGDRVKGGEIKAILTRLAELRKTIK